MLQSPTSYQGGKARLASVIVEKLLEKSKTGPFYDLCCGSGAVTLELINQGIDPSNITMCDAGPWGLFWKEIGEGSFDVSLLETMVAKLPELNSIKDYMQQLSKQPASQATTQIFLLLQAASFGSKPIWIENNIWRNCSFRSYWLPTETSNRRSPVNPMMPLPTTLVSRVKNLVEKCKGINGIHGSIETISIAPEAIIYIDPPYKNTTPYGHNIDVVSFSLSMKNICLVSEGYQIPEAHSFYLLADEKQRKKGGISGAKKIAPNLEYLNVFRG